MKVSTSIIAASVAALFSMAASAQSLESIEQRDLMQQQRIYQGLQSGQLTAREASRLESETNRIDRMQARSLQDGRLSESERDRITQAQNRVGREIYSETHDRQIANPNSRSSQYMQNSVRGEIHEDRRILNGVASGRLDHREAARAEIRNVEGRGGYDGQRFQHGDDRRGRDDNRFQHGNDRRGGDDNRFQRHDDNGRPHAAGHRGFNEGPRNVQPGVPPGVRHGSWNPPATPGQHNDQHGGWSRGATNASPTGLSNGRHEGWNRTPAPASTAATAPASNGRQGGWNQGSTRGSGVGSGAASAAASTVASSGVTTTASAAATSNRGNYTARASQAGSPRVMASASVGGGQRSGGTRNR